MTRILEAVYEAGVLKPLQDPQLEENQHVVLEIRPIPREEASSVLASWHQVYEGLSDEEVAAVEAIALDREHFLREEG